MDLTTEYMGLKLKNPLVVSASPLSQTLDNFRRLEDAGASAVVVYSLFEEQITRDAKNLDQHLTQGTDSFAESLSFFPTPDEFVLGPEEYLDHIRKAKAMVGIPIIASLNGHSVGGWTEYAQLMEQAGADALELNVYFLATDSRQTSAQIEQTYLDVLKAVKSKVKIPVSVKLGPFFSSLANMTKRLDEGGADGLVLFNRFYQPDIDLDTLEIEPNLLLSTSHDMRLPMRWIAVLYGQLKASLGATSGIHQAQDVLKMLMVGSDVTMLCSTLLRNGIGQITKIRKDMETWMTEHEYESVKQMKGSLSQKSCADPEAFERANYMRVLRSFR